ncbi:MAG: hypothetical protein OSJ52_07165, partial [Lachnospiraceae bacterium]|nr:hypothetical protein [Lachnospiraceae bacterium]
VWASRFLGSSSRICRCRSIHSFIRITLVYINHAPTNKNIHIPAKIFLKMPLPERFVRTSLKVREEG